MDGISLSGPDCQAPGAAPDGSTAAPGLSHSPAVSEEALRVKPAAGAHKKLKTFY